jgi:hypothetical protein
MGEVSQDRIRVMSPSREKAVASRIGLPLAEYRAKVAAGLKRCQRCKHWKKRDAHFGKDVSSWDGLQHRCRFCQSRQAVESGRRAREAARARANG